MKMVLIVLFFVSSTVYAEYSPNDFKDDLIGLHEMRQKLTDECSAQTESASCGNMTRLSRIFYELSLLTNSKEYGKQVLDAELKLSKDAFKHYKNTSE